MLQNGNECGKAKVMIISRQTSPVQDYDRSKASGNISTVGVA